jgi:molecular chaperone IbpA
MRTYDITPLWRSTIGFDRFFDLAEAAQHAAGDELPTLQCRPPVR